MMDMDQPPSAQSNSNYFEARSTVVTHQPPCSGMVTMVRCWQLMLLGMVHSAALKTLAPPAVLPLQRFPQRHGIRSAAERLTERLERSMERVGRRSGLAGTTCSSRQISALSKHQSVMKHSMKRNRLTTRDGQLSMVRLKDLASTEYVGVLGVGSNCGVTGRCVPAAELYVVFDTGSADVWLASDLCTSGPCTMEGRHRFNRSSSSSFHQDQMPQAFTTEYATGSLSGVMGTDQLWLGPEISAKAQQFGLISQEYGSAFLTIPIDGIVGLGFQELVNTNSKALMETLVEEKVLAHVEFAFFFFQDISKGGALIWGHAEQLKLHEGSITWFPVAQEKYWSVPLRGFRLGRNSTEDLLHLLLPFERHPEDGPVMASAELYQKAQLILDSGTTFFTAPPRLFSKITTVMEPTSCHHINVFPDLVFTVGTDLRNFSAVQELVVPPEVYMVRDPFEHHCEPGFMNLAALPQATLAEEEASTRSQSPPETRAAVSPPKAPERQQWLPSTPVPPAPGIKMAAPTQTTAPSKVPSGPNGHPVTPAVTGVNGYVQPVQEMPVVKSEL
eukprot:s93_g18.t1